MSNQPKNRPAKPQQKAPNLLAGLEPAGWGRRIAALFIDWAISTLVLIAIVGVHNYSKPGGSALVVPVFLVEVYVLTVLTGGSFGQIAVRIRVRRVDGAPLGPGALLIRTILICLVIPPVIYKPGGRGLHDMAVNSTAFHVL